MRLVDEAMADDPQLSLNAAVKRIGQRVGIVPDTLRGWAKQRRIDGAEAAGTTSSDAARITELERELRAQAGHNLAEIVLRHGGFVWICSCGTEGRRPAASAEYAERMHSDHAKRAG